MAKGYLRTKESKRLLNAVRYFTYDSYKSLLRVLMEHYTIIPFRDYRSTTEPKLILRHDVDASMSRALHLARLENKLELRSTFMVGFSMRFYNPCEKSALEQLREIVGLGHEIGLHYDLQRYPSYFSTPVEILNHEIRTLEMLTGTSVKTIARHNVSLGGDDPFRENTSLINAYDRAFTESSLYVSDSCRAWCTKDLRRLIEQKPPRVQLLIHPMLWSDKRCTRYELLDRFIEDLQDENERYKRYWKGSWRSSERVREYDGSVMP